MAEFLDLQTWSILIAIFVGLAGFAFTVIIYIRKTRKDDADKIEANREKEATKLNAIKEAEAQRIKTEKEAARLELEKYTTEVAKELRAYTENMARELKADNNKGREELVRMIGEVADDVKTNMQGQLKMIRRLNERQGFTNSNMYEMTNLILDGQEQSHDIVEAMAAKGIAVKQADANSMFKKDMQRKREAALKRSKDQEPEKDENE